MVKPSVGDLRDVIIPFPLIRNKLVQERMLVSDVIKILGVTKRQLLYWDTGKSEMKKADERKYHSWRRFSIIDLLEFSILKEWREIGAKLEICYYVLGCVSAFFEFPQFLFEYAEGKPLFISVGMSADGKKYIKNTYDGVFVSSQGKGIKLNIVVDLRSLFTAALKNAAREDFYVEFIEMKKDRSKAIFYVNKEKIELKPLKQIYGNVGADAWEKITEKI